MSNIEQALDRINAELEKLYANEETYGSDPKRERKLRKVRDILKAIL